MTDLNLQLATAATAGDLARVASLLALGANPRHSDSLPICRAAWGGHADCVKLLIPLSDPNSHDSEALALAALIGQSECVRLLIPFSDPRAEEPSAFRREPAAPVSPH